MRLRTLYLTIVFAIFSAVAAHADTKRCVANLNGTKTILEFDKRTTEYRTFWEGWSPLAPDCPSAAIIAKLKPDVPLEDLSGYCLITDQKSGAYLAVIGGESDRFGRCKQERQVCKVVNTAKDFAVAAANGIGGAILGSKSALQSVGAVAAEHGSGGLILKAGSGYIAGTLGSVGATAVSVISAPGVLIGAATGAVVIGGAVLVCAE